jgi:hypothetical protein
MGEGRSPNVAESRESAKYVETVGSHLVGLPEVYVAKTLGTDLEKAAMMDAIAI